MRNIFLTAILICSQLLASAQPKTIKAIRTLHSIKIDGDTNDEGWSNITPVSGFTTSFPEFGKQPARNTEVKITYDNTAIYILAYLYDKPDNIRRQLTARDDLRFKNTDVFTVGIDTYNDKQNGFQFQVSAAGVQADAKISSVVDDSWDAVWESKVSLRKDGWVAEIKIPFSAIRFSKMPLQTWGIQFTRFRRISNETSTWSPDDQDVSGTINKWGQYEGLKDLSPPLRLSFLPYISGGVRVSPVGNSKVTEYLTSGGMDVKYGINESFTLDLTLIPDFAQVQSDNVVLNLSPFDIKFEDFRPFFTEGTELFNKAGIFYSRRIGSAPSGAYGVLAKAASDPNYEIIKNPGITRLYNATKFSGRTKGNLGVGIFNAITAPMNAELRDHAADTLIRINTEPLTNYNIIVLDQALKNRSSITFTNTNVLRKGNSRNANVSAIDISLFDKENRHQLFVDGIYSSIWGKDGTYDGYNADIRYKKVSGKLQYLFSAGAMSDKYDPNDLGFLQRNNQFSYVTDWSYLINRPTKHFQIQRYSLGATNMYLYKPFLWQNFAVNSSAFLLMKNFWDVTAQFQLQPLWSNDFFELRTPGLYLKRPPVYYLDIIGSTDSRKKLFVNYEISGAESPLPKDPYYGGTLGFRYRFSDKFQLTTEAHAETDQGNYGYAFRDPITSQPVIGRRSVKSNYTILAGDYHFNSLMNFTVRLRHYWSQVDYHQFYDVKPDGYWEDRVFSPGRDFNFNTFNVDLFYTWDFLAGSRLTLSWKNALGADVYIDGVENRSYIKNFSRVFEYPHSNELNLKVVYYIDYLSLRNNKKKVEKINTVAVAL